MQNLDRYTSMNFIKTMLNDMDKKLTKGLGQNFLIDSSVIEDIIYSSGVDKNVAVLEIGVGIGALTYALIQSAIYLISVEIDNKLWDYIDEEFGEWDNFELIKADVLKVDLEEVCNKLLEKADKIYVVANLPYHITTPIIMKFLESDLPVDKIVVMVQKEVALRMSASTNCKDYGSLTVNLNTFADVDILFDVSPSSFMPRPKVDSSVIEINVKKEIMMDKDEREFFLKLVKSAFHARRKKMVNSINGILGISKEKIENALIEIGRDKNVRAENLNSEEFLALSRLLRSSNA